MEQKIEQRFHFERTVHMIGSEELGKGKHVRKAHYDINCLMCNVIFRVTEKQLDRKFCSSKCLHNSFAIEFRGPSHKRSGQCVECRVCKKETWVKQSRIDAGKGRCCSRECYLREHPSTLKFPKQIRICLFCKHEFTVSQSKTAPTYCSVSCSQLHSYASGRHPPVDGRNNGRFGRPPKYMKYDPLVDRLGRTFRMRSSYEIALVEQCLDKLEMTWDYEPKTFDLGDTTYTPDFWVEELHAFVETKGYMRDEARKKIELFRRMNPDVKLIVATEDVLRENFELNLSKEVISDIQTRYNAKTYLRRDQKVMV